MRGVIVFPHLFHRSFFFKHTRLRLVDGNGCESRSRMDEFSAWLSWCGKCRDRISQHKPSVKRLFLLVRAGESCYERIRG